jgi:4'-phosphopantetheinyl transferase
MNALSVEEIHLWFLDLAVSKEEIDRFRSLLSPEEIARADRYHFDRDRHRFTVARGRLRQLLGEYTGIEPQKIDFTYSDRGKPRINASIQFNLSHSGEVALYGFGGNRRIGVDVEEMRSIDDLEGLTKRFFCDREHELIKNSLDKEGLFFQLWTAKEAYLKAIGTGIAGGLDAVEVSIEPLGIANVEGKWSLWTCRPRENYIATVAIEGNPPQVKTFGLFERGYPLLYGDREKYPAGNTQTESKRGETTFTES